MKKFKLINRTTREETICDKVTIEGFDYFVSDDKLKIKDWGIENISNNLYQCEYIKDDIYLTKYKTGSKYWKKVIATNNPYIDIPQVIDEAKELGYKHYVSNAHYKVSDGFHFELGYTKSQETHPFSSEDIEMFYLWLHKPNENDIRQPNVVYVPSSNHYWHKHKKYNFKDLLKLWKDLQPKVLCYQ